LNQKKKKLWLSSILLSFILLLLPLTSAFAESDNNQPDSWALSELLDAEALNLLPDNFDKNLHETITSEQSNYIVYQIDKKLVSLGYESNTPFQNITCDGTRGNFIKLLYEELLRFDLPEPFTSSNSSAVEYMVQNQILVGDGNGNLALERNCTLQEALMIAQRFLTDFCRRTRNASEGLLWKATNGDNVLYLLGTIHVDRGNIYPYSKGLSDVITQVDAAYFEVDLLDEEGLLEFSKLQRYSDGTTLKDHISPELYEIVVAVLGDLGLTEAQAASYKPWALASTFSNLALEKTDRETAGSSVAIDLYVYQKALVSGAIIGEVEGYVFQGELLDSLSQEYQEAYLAGNLFSYLYGLENEEPSAAVSSVDEMLKMWSKRDAVAFEAYSAKEDQLASGDELSILLFEKRDQNMIAFADNLLCQEGEKMQILVVGAGHMVGESGIVNGLKKLGYEVELVPSEYDSRNEANSDAA
jgi:uncharacterized protein YbaP (TraB family)